MPFMFKIVKVSAFHKMQGAPTGPDNNVRKPLSSLCSKYMTCKINLGGLDFRFKITEVIEHINGRENKKKMKKIYLTIF